MGDNGEKKNTKDRTGMIVSLVATVFTIISTGFTIIWSVFIYYQFLPLKKANLIFLEDSNITHLKIEKNENESETYDIIEPIIKNIGNSTAKDVKFRIYAISFEEKFEFPENSENIIEYFNEQVVHDLSPQTTLNFGLINFLKDNLPKNENNCSSIQQIAFVCYLEFIDSLSGDKENRFFLFQYGVGDSKFRSIISRDYNKISGRFINWLEQKENSPEELISFLKSKK